MVGDILRLVARTTSKQVMKEAEETTALHQHAPSSRSVASAWRTFCCPVPTNEDASVTIVSVDGIGAYDTISRRAMLQGVLQMPSADRVLPLLKQFCSSPSTYVWEDDMETQHEVTQGDGGEQGDPLMPISFCLGQNGALAAVEGRLTAGEKLFAFLDVIYLICQPDRVQDAHRILEELRTRVGIRVHHCGEYHEFSIKFSARVFVVMSSEFTFVDNSDDITLFFIFCQITQSLTLS